MSTNLDDLDEKEIERRFHVAVKNIQNNKETKLPFKPSTSQQLFFYGRYKQATVGDCQGDQPSLWYPVKRYMWSAHDKNRGKPKLQAMKEYVEEINKLAGEFDLSSLTPDLRELADQFFAELNGTGPYAPKTETATTTTSTSAIAAETTLVPTTATTSNTTPTPISATVTPTATATPTPTATTNGHSHAHINGTNQINGKNVSATVAKFNGMNGNGVTKSNNKINPPSTPPSAPITTPTPNNTPGTVTTTSTSTSTSTPTANGHTSKRSRAARRRASQTQQAQASQSQVAAPSTQRYQAKTSTTSTSNNSSPSLQPSSTSSSSNSPSLSASTAPTATSTFTSTSPTTQPPSSTSPSPSPSPSPSIPPIDTSVPTDAAALSARLLHLQRENHQKLLQLEAHILNVTKKATQTKVPAPSSDSSLNDTVQQLEQKQQQRQTTFSQAEESWRNQLARIEQVQASLLDRVSHLHPRTLAHVQQTFADIPTRTRHGVEPVPKQEKNENQPQESFTPSSTTQAVVTVIAAATGLGVLCYAGYKTWRYIQEKRKA